MTVLEKKYGLDKDNALKMARDGILSTSILYQAEIYDYFRAINKKAVQAVTETADHFDVSERFVWNVLKKFR